jgi:tRNA wybutosine-synthesizing protein 3
MYIESNFLLHKLKAIKKLNKAKIEKNVDVGIIPTLDLINSKKEYYTTSSCFGRIILLEIPMIGDKRNAHFLGKWHRTVKSEEILKVSIKATNGLLWLIAQSPIIHIGAKTNTSANKLLKIAVKSGLKNSGLKSIDRNVIVEIVSTERLDAPIGKDGKLYCNGKYLSLLVDIANDVFERSSLKIQKFYDNLKNIS